jgi:hypothetical protein
MPIEILEEFVSEALIFVMEGHLTRLNSKINNLRMQLSMLNTTVASHVEEHTRLCNVGRHAPDREKQQTTISRTPLQDFTIILRQQLESHTRVGTLFVRARLT